MSCGIVKCLQLDECCKADASISPCCTENATVSSLKKLLERRAPWDEPWEKE